MVHHAGLIMAALAIPSGPQPLPLGERVSGRTKPDAEAVYTLEVAEPGGLAVAVRTTDGKDVFVSITDEVGQDLIGGYLDDDRRGNLGAEQGLVSLPAAGRYRVYIEAYDEPADFALQAVFLPMPEMAAPPDPHGSPTDAIELAPGRAQGEAIRPERGDHRDWYVIRPEKGGVMTVYTRGTGDLTLERFAEGDYRTILHWADDDVDEQPAHESVTFDVAADEAVYFRVSGYGADASDYTITAGFVGGD